MPALTMTRVDRTASIIAARLLHFGFKGALDSYSNPNRIDFARQSLAK